MASTHVSVPPPGGHNIMSVEIKAASPTLDTVSGLTACLSKLSAIPSEVDKAMRETALNLLKGVVEQGEETGIRGLPAFVLQPVGSYGLGVWTATSDIDCLCIGPVSSDLFFALIIQRIRIATPRMIKILRRVDTPSGEILELEVGNIKMKLQYCSATQISSTWPAMLTLPPTDPIFAVSPNTLEKLKPLRDLHHLKQTVPDMATFKLAFQTIKCWAKQRGIYAAKFGYLGGIQISMLLSRVLKLSFEDGPITAPTILTTFYHHYAGFDWKSDVVFDPFFHKHLSYVRTQREHMAILGFHGPKLNTAQTASAAAVHVISEEFKRADVLLSESGMTWPRFLREDTGALEFLNAYPHYAQITVQFWGPSLAKGSQFLSWLEDRCTLLVNDLNREVAQLNPRIWPARFVSRDISNEDSTYIGHYLIGLDLRALTKNSIETTVGRVNVTLQRFEHQIFSTKQYDSATSYIVAETVPRSAVEMFRIDDRDWGRYTIEAEEDELGELYLSTSAAVGEGADSQSRSKKEPNIRQTTRPAYEGKLRPAGDVLNRLRWDLSMDSSDYIVGYEDRFTGAVERSVDSWKSETTHEEFIPEHRILYFKRKSDGLKVWDKEERRDEIFGSGVSSLR